MASSIRTIIALMGLLVTVLSVQTNAAKNVIIMIGDGMGFEHVKAGSYFKTGASGNLSFEPYYRCSITTKSLNSSVTDSAAAATALATGYKVNNGVISQAPDGAPYTTILEKATAMGKRTGLVTTVQITHATPAGFGAHESSRSNYISIGNDYLLSSHPDVLFGGGGNASGGSPHFSTAQINTAVSQGYATAYDADQLAALNPTTVNKALGLFDSNEMNFEYDRNPSDTQPRLAQMATKALDILNADPDGFFLMVEGGNIDKAAHARNIERTVGEVVEFGNAVEAVLKWMQGRNDTLLIVTADHETGGLSATNQGIGVYPAATWKCGDHTADNVPLYITGANADLAEQYIVSGVMDNTDVFKIMDKALATPMP